MKNANNLGQRGNHHAGIPHNTSSSLAPDFNVSHHGSVVLFHPRTELARDWLSEHCSRGADHTYFGAALVVEPRYVNDLVAQAIEDGLNTTQP
jgi:hypothetical protein